MQHGDRKLMCPSMKDADPFRANIIAHLAGVLSKSTARIIVGASLLGVRADLAIELDEHEHARRQRAPAGQLDDFDVLMFLMGLPQDEQVRVQELNVDERSMLRRAPAGAIETRGEFVVRIARPPVRSVLAVVHDERRDRGLRAASVFAPVATRMLIMSALPADATDLLAEAAEYGIGVGTPTETGVCVHAEPELWRQRQFTPGGWMFREQVYQLAVADAP